MCFKASVWACPNTHYHSIEVPDLRNGWDDRPSYFDQPMNASRENNRYLTRLIIVALALHGLPC